MKKSIYFFAPIFLVFVIIFCIITPSVAMSEDLSQKVLRLHILANSDSENDQRLKLKVRDSIIEYSNELYNGCTSVEEAISRSEKSLDKIIKIAESTVRKNGFNYSVKAVIGKEYYNTRYYSDFVLPAGEYNSIRIVIGKGNGHNWWCVMFPQVCLSGCTDDFNGYITDEEKRMITSGGYAVRLKSIELIEKLKAKVKANNGG